MTTLQFCLSLVALLFAPGPTNALLALSGAESGVRRSLRLLPLVAVAYATTVVPLSALGEDLLRQHHWVRAGVTLAAALWVAWMAYALWRQTGNDAQITGSVGGMRLFITTLLNPKAFIIGLVLIPSQPHPVTALGLFLAVLIATAAGWTLMGGAMHGKDLSRLRLLRRVCAGWLGLLAVMLGSAALSA